jgi:hypothetical protein
VELFTNRYQKAQPSQGLMVRTTLGAPRFKLRYELDGNLPQLAPSRDIFRKPYGEFRTAYRRHLHILGPKHILEAIEAIRKASSRPDEQRMVLLCFDDLSKEGAWCHRTMFAEWWLEKTGEEVRELDATGGWQQPNDWAQGTL